MRKAKRIVAFVLALTMMFALVAMTASAVVPRAACSKCGSLESTHHTTLLQSYNEYVGGCAKINTPHTHIHRQLQNTIICKNCRDTYNSDPYWTITCG